MIVKNLFFLLAKSRLYLFLSYLIILNKFIKVLVMSFCFYINKQAKRIKIDTIIIAAIKTILLFDEESWSDCCDETGEFVCAVVVGVDVEIEDVDDGNVGINIIDH